MFEIEGPNESLRGLFAFIRRLQQPGSGDWRKVSDAVTQGFARNFQSESSARGAWRPLAPFTVMDRIEKGFAGQHPILVRTGRGRASFVDRGALDHIERFANAPDGWTLEVGSDSPIMYDMEYGWERIPARPITPLGDDAQRRIADVIDYIIAQAQAQTVGR